VLAEHVADGRTNGQIARTLGLSEKIVRNGVSTLLANLAVPDRLAVALLARDVGLVEPVRIRLARGERDAPVIR
jgi:two-component system, NarL family, nitrate/nitrite response regulator NarL